MNASRRKKGGEGGNGVPTTAARSPASAPDPVRGVSFPTETLGRFLPLYYPGPNGLTLAVILSDWIFAWSTHWCQGRTTPHVVEPPEACEGCRHGQRPRWTGYVHALSHPTGTHVLYQISGEAYLSCPQLAQQDGSLRGVLLELRRTGQGRQGRQVARLLSYAAPPDLPPPVDLRARLDRLWGMTDGWVESQCGPYPRGLNRPGTHKEGEK
jgi:hypothetical protein